MVNGRKKEDLDSFIGLTKIFEGVHAFGLLPLYTTMTIIGLANKDYIHAGIWTISNLGINIYPIISQRYNRNKANQMLERLEERRARKMLIPYQ